MQVYVSFFCVNTIRFTLILLKKQMGGTTERLNFNLLWLQGWTTSIWKKVYSNAKIYHFKQAKNNLNLEHTHMYIYMYWLKGPFFTSAINRKWHTFPK